MNGRPLSDADLSRLCEATRPAEPSDAAWDGLWARVCEGLDRPAGTSEPLALASPRWGRYALPGLVAAQAAALLAAALLGLTHHNRPIDPPPPTVTVARSPLSVDIDFGEDVLIREDGTKLLTAALRQSDRPDALDGNFAMLNDIEAMAE